MLISRGAIQGILPSEINVFPVFLATLLSVLIQEMRAKAGGCSLPLEQQSLGGWDCCTLRTTLGLGKVLAGGRVGNVQGHWVIRGPGVENRASPLPWGLFSHSVGAGEMDLCPQKPPRPGVLPPLSHVPKSFWLHVRVTSQCIQSICEWGISSHKL